MPSYSDSEMRAIMGRALQIDSGRSERFTPEQLRTIAGELGISTQALEVAMYEADSKGGGLMVDDPPPRGGTSGWAKGVMAAVGALVIILGAFVVMRRVAPERPQIHVIQEQPTPVVDQGAPAAKVQVEPEGPRPVPRKTTTKIVR